ncbi:MAG: hypothetical protein Q9227_005934 [Pyrenula ochraceoflavens]
MASNINDDKAGSALTPAIAFTVIASIFILLRFISRAFVVRSPGADDALIVGALIFYASIPIYNLALTFTKISILLQIRRVFAAGGRIQRTSLLILGLIIIYGLWTFWASIFTCFPVQKFWDTSIKRGYCLNRTGYWFSNASLNIVTDCLIWGLPMPVLRTLQLPKRQKVGLMLIFAVGIFAIITSILRLHSLYVVSKSKDVTWDNVDAGAWSSVEINVGILCATLPSLRPLITRLFPRLLHGSSHARASPHAAAAAAAAAAPQRIAVGEKLHHRSSPPANYMRDGTRGTFNFALGLTDAEILGLATPAKAHVAAAATPHNGIGIGSVDEDEELGVVGVGAGEIKVRTRIQQESSVRHGCRPCRGGEEENGGGGGVESLKGSRSSRAGGGSRGSGSGSGSEEGSERRLWVDGL